MTVARGFVCLSCGTEYATIDALIASGHWLRRPCPDARPSEPTHIAPYCKRSDHSRCPGRFSREYTLCLCDCHQTYNPPHMRTRSRRVNA